MHNFTSDLELVSLKNALQCANTQELQLICNCCGQPYYPNKTWQDQLNAVMVGSEKYAICPICTQAVPEQTFNDYSYRLRCQKEVRRLQRLYNAEKTKRSRK